MFVECFPGCCGQYMIGGFDNFNGNCDAVTGFDRNTYTAKMGEKYTTPDKARLWLLNIFEKFGSKYSIVCTTTYDQPEANAIFRSLGFEPVQSGTKRHAETIFYMWSLEMNGYKVPDNICTETGKAYYSAQTMKAGKARSKLAALKREKKVKAPGTLVQAGDIVRIAAYSSYYTGQAHLLGEGRVESSAEHLHQYRPVRSVLGGYVNSYPSTDLIIISRAE